MASGCGSGVAGFICHAVPFIPIAGGWIDVGGNAAKKAVSVAGSDVLSQIAKAMASAADGLLNTLSTFWMNVETPDMTGTGSPVAAIQGDIRWLTACTAVVCVLVAAARMAIRRRGEPGTVMAIGLARLVVVSAVATFLIQTAGQLGDTFSADLMRSAHLGSTGWSGVISTTALAGAFAGGDGMLLIIALLVVFSSLIQLALMILRVGLMVIMTGTLPLAAAASMSDWGENWWRKHVAWLTAWLLYKPAAALLYAAAFTLTDQTNGEKRTGVEVISGFMLLILSILILPALLKVIVPMTARLGAASSGTLAMGAAGAVATGAIKIAAIAGTGGTARPAKADATGTGDTTAGTPSGNAALAGDKPAGAPDGAGIRTEADPPPRRQPGSSERAVVQPSSTPSPAPEGTSASASGSPPSSSSQGRSSAGDAPPANDDTTQHTRRGPSGAHGPERPGAAGLSGPPGAVDDGDDEEREIGG